MTNIVMTLTLYIWLDLPRLAPEFCEALLSQWIAQPSNAWSSLAYCAVGVWLLLHQSQQDGRSLRLMGPIAIAIGLASFAYHALYIKATHFLDLLSMFGFSTLILVLNLVRARLIPRRCKMIVWAVILGLSTLTLIFFLDIGRALFGVAIGLALALETNLAMCGNHVEYIDFSIALGLFLVAFIIWNLDIHKIVCDPHNHILQGHAVWHILTALALVFVTRFYRQFSVVK